MLNPDFRDILSAFIDERVDFLVVGGYAMAAHRLPRVTKDLDLWVRPSADNARRVLPFVEIHPSTKWPSAHRPAFRTTCGPPPGARPPAKPAFTAFATR